MSFLFGRQGSRPELPRLKPRARRSDENVNRVALDELTPDLTAFLGRAAAVQLSIFETTALDRENKLRFRRRKEEVDLDSLTYV